MARNLAYRLKRFFRGESGVVEKVEDVQTFTYDPQTGVKLNYWFPRDDYGYHPRNVTFRNPLGELVTRHTPIETVAAFEIGPGQYKKKREYKHYHVGDKFP